MTARWGRHTARWLAAETGFSAGYIRKLVAAAKAFHDPASRAANLHFSHHAEAALTHDPAGWIDRAVAEGLSVRELRAAIRAARDPVARAEQARQVAERIQQAVRRFNERWSALYGSGRFWSSSRCPSRALVARPDSA
ncbi:MAG: hypothetical protein K6V97_09550 [Actinomycetia bacterium]|nr:hypothetical protein [Actinomycetes bacterium]